MIKKIALNRPALLDQILDDTDVLSLSGPRGPTPQQDMGSMHDMGPSRGPVSRTDMGPMHGMGGPRGPGPRSDMGQMHEMGMPRGPVPRPDMGPMRDMGGPRGPHPRAVRPDQPDPRGVSVGGDRGRAPPPRQAAVSARGREEGRG